LSWYRYIPSSIPTFLRSFYDGTAHVPSSVRTLILWGDKDPYLQVGLAYYTQKWFAPHATVKVLEGVSHWVQHEEPEVVGGEVVGFLSGEGGEDGA
ncbi:hypothetical protein HK102_005650, partial [Quaeritorhiza haematococci]